ncbi:MAG: hypothetical protein WAU65_02105 [Candidatus Nanoarchaeia archaeon]
MPNRKKSEAKYWYNENKADKMKWKMYHHSAPCGVYFLGFVGAVVYYIQQSTTFWQGVVAVLKALVWPAFLVYKLLGL